MMSCPLIRSSLTDFLFVVSDAAPRLLQENQKYLCQLTSLMQEAADEQANSIVVSPLLSKALVWISISVSVVEKRFNIYIYKKGKNVNLT